MAQVGDSIETGIGLLARAYQKSVRDAVGYRQAYELLYGGRENFTPEELALIDEASARGAELMLVHPRRG